MSETQIITRAEAKTAGLGRYYTGEVCRHGHVADRYVSDGRCVACVAERNAANRQYVESGRRQEVSRRWLAANTARNAANVGWQRAKRLGATLPADFSDAAALLDATEPFYAAARSITEQTGIAHEIDHVIPIGKGGQHVPANLRVVPKWFNAAKSSRTPCEYLKAIQSGISRSSRPTEALVLAQVFCAETAMAASV